MSLRQSGVVGYSVGQRPSPKFRYAFGTHPSLSSIGWEYGIKVPVWDKRVPNETPGHVPGSERSRYESHRPSGQRQQYGMCKFAFVGHWGHQGREGNFPHPPNRGRSVQGHQPQPRSESAGGAGRSPEGSPPRRRRQTCESGDAGGRGTPGRQPVVVAAESGKHPRDPNEGRTELAYAFRNLLFKQVQERHDYFIHHSSSCIITHHSIISGQTSQENDDEHRFIT